MKGRVAGDTVSEAKRHWILESCRGHGRLNRDQFKHLDQATSHGVSELWV